MAIQCHMPLDEFWYGEEDLLNAYAKAYYNDCKYTAWLNGQYTYIAQLTATTNTWGGKEGKKAEYPSFESVDDKYIEQQEKTKPKGNNDNAYLSQFY